MAAVLDDAAQGVNLVMRGQDLFESTHIHRLLQALLDLAVPDYDHHRLVIGRDGKRLAKRKGSVSLADLRAEGMNGNALAEMLRCQRFPVGFGLGEA
jgi:glutamyl-Q tRNA(Asp) synthetase